MLAAFAEVTRQRPARLVLVGEGGYRPVVERLVGELGLAKHVLLMGQRLDVPGLLKSADVFLFCSRTEGLPNAVLEAMAAALPIVATDVPGCRDLVRHQETGLLAAAGSPSDIARCVLALIGHPARAGQLGRNARAWVCTHADTRSLADRWTNLYLDVLGGPQAVPAGAGRLV